MKRLFILLVMTVAVVMGISAQKDYRGQVASIKLASGDSLSMEMMIHSIAPKVKDGEIVWSIDRYEVKDVKSIDLRSPEQSEAMARQALIEFYKAMDGDHWYNNTNWCSDKPIGEWFGVESGDRPYVSTIYMPSNNLKGTLPSGIFTGMGPMAMIRLADNQISGSFPKEIVNDVSLQYLQIERNQITGELPEGLPKLPIFRHLSVSDNNMTGKIPASVSRMMGTKNSLDISGNDFSGDVPEEIVNHPDFHLTWDYILPQRGHLNLPTIPGYKLTVTDLNGNQLETTDVYKNNFYTLIFNYSSARNFFTDKLKIAYETYKNKGFEVLGMATGDTEEINEYLHTNNISWLNLDPETFSDKVGRYFLYLNFINLVDQKGNVVFTSIMDEKGKMENTWGESTRDQQVFDVLKEKFGSVDFTPYTSTDYSRDGEVLTLQQASKGQGIDIVFVGNCFVDKDMEPGGKYEQKMRDAMEQFFAFEPLTSLRDRFNVYAVKAVSPNAELFEGTKHAISTNADALEYAQKVTTLIPNRPMRVNVIYNSFNAGRSVTSMFEDHSYVAHMYSGINLILNHEGCGHGIGRLYDEYVEENGSSLSQEWRDYYDEMWTTYGRGANIDWHSDVTKTRWARFAADSRYASENLGTFEGSGLFEFGMYRPTQNSMMRFNNCPFNAPSREAIYKYVMQESEGPSWKYDYETFVAFDAKGRAEFAKAMEGLSYIKGKDGKGGSHLPDESIDKKSLPLPPVFVKGTWRDALQDK